MVYNGGFHKWGVPQNGWFIIRENPSINGWWLGVPLFQETPIWFNVLIWYDAYVYIQLLVMVLLRGAPSFKTCSRELKWMNYIHNVQFYTSKELGIVTKETWRWWPTRMLAIKMGIEHKLTNFWARIDWWPSGIRSWVKEDVFVIYFHWKSSTKDFENCVCPWQRIQGCHVHIVHIVARKQPTKPTSWVKQELIWSLLAAKRLWT